MGADDGRTVPPRPPLGDDELDSLVGVYAIGALDEAERDQVDRYLATHPAAAAEATRLSRAFDEVLDAHASAHEPPSRLWDQIAERLPERAGNGGPIVVPSPAAEPPVTRLDDRRRIDAPRARAPRRFGALAAAAAVVVVAAIGGGLAGRAGRSDATLAATAAQVASLDGSRQARLAGADGAERARIVVDDDDAAYVVPTDLPVLDDDHTYQLWALDGTQPISLGLVGNGAATSRLTVGGRPRQLALSEEPTGGSGAPTMAVAAGALA